MKKNLKLENLLRDFLNIMVKRYTWLTIKFEYNENKEQYLVSYSPKDKIQSDANGKFICRVIWKLCTTIL